MNQIDRILFREVERYMKRTSGPTERRAGAVTFVQRFGGSLNLNAHFHVLFLAGLLTTLLGSRSRHDGDLDLDFNSDVSGLASDDFEPPPPSSDERPPPSSRPEAPPPDT